MRWCCFLFWFWYRLILACLAHFNWALALYTNCIYFTLWKSYDLLWSVPWFGIRESFAKTALTVMFWMHITLCSCFPALRRENYLIVWTNMFIKRCTKYPNHTFKQIYLILYGGKGTKAERALERMETIERREKEDRRSRRIARKQNPAAHVDSSSSSDSDEEGNHKKFPFPTYSGKPPLKPQKNNIPKVILEEEERECRKYVFVGTAEDSTADLQRENVGEDDDLESAVVEVANPEDVAEQVKLGDEQPKFGLELESPKESPKASPQEPKDPETSSVRSWLIEKVPTALKNKIQRSRQNSGQPLNGEAGGSTGTTPQQAEDTVSVGTTWSARLQRLVPRLPKSVKIETDTADMDILRPDYTNSHDVKDPKIQRKREKHQRKELTKKVRARIKAELEEVARIEKKLLADQIELLLQLLRMITSFAILVGNIRKTFIPAQIRLLKPGERAADDSLLLLFRATVFMDVTLFWTNALWIYCLQWHLCCRLGFFRFWFWALILAVVAGFGMMVPMSYIQNQLDLSWCNFYEGSPLYPYQPKWN